VAKTSLEAYHKSGVLVRHRQLIDRLSNLPRTNTLAFYQTRHKAGLSNILTKAAKQSVTKFVAVILVTLKATAGKSY
jgi:hypothetical protein